MLLGHCLSHLNKVRALFRVRRVFHTNVKHRNPKRLPDPWDLATGLERWVMIQYAKGNIDPFYNMTVVRGPGTKDCPNVIYSFYDKKLVGCICHPDNHHIIYFMLHECYPRRCDCNYWFVLKRVEFPKIYEC